MSNGEYEQVAEGTVHMPVIEEEKMPIEGEAADSLHYVENRSDPLFGPVPPEDAARSLSSFGDLSASEREEFERWSSEKQKEYFESLVRVRRTQVDVPSPESPTFKSDQVDVAELLSAQAKFIEEQSRFLEVGSSLRGTEYIGALTHYSKAQSMLLKAQGDVLRQLGVV